MRFEICSKTSPNRRKAIGRGSTRLAEAITIISPTNPRICQSGQVVGRGVGALGAGVETINPGVGEAGILVLVGVAEGNGVDVVVGVKVGVMVGKAPSGMEILPVALAQRL